MSLERLASHLDRPLVVIDVGCREGEAATWTRFGPHVRLIGFEPDPDECARLQRELDGPAERRFVPLALGAQPGEATLHLTRFPQSSSLYEPDPRTIEAHPQLSAHELVGKRTVDVTTLDVWLAQSGEHPPDFLKIDVQGAELDVLHGATEAIEDVRAVEVEVEFQPLYRDQPLFADVDAWLRAKGFVLWRLRGLRHLAISGAPAPPNAAALLAADAERHPSGGQLSWADGAIYVRSGFGRSEAEGSWTTSLRDACIAAAMGLPELARVAIDSASAQAPAAVRGDLEAVRRGELLMDVDTAADVTARDSPQEAIARLTEERDQARAEVERLRPFAAPLAVTEPALRGMRAGITRMRHWSRPRLGVMRQHSPAPLRVPSHQLLLRPPRKPPSIALVTPSYNQGAFIERTIRSVLDQDYPALSYVVQDGGSDDETTAVLRAYAPLLAACVSEPDDGQADAINRGFAVARGEIMGWLNSDDMLLPGALAAVARHFARHPETDVVYGHRAVIDEDDRQVGAWILPSHADWTLRLADVIPQETMFWRRSAWEAAGGRLNPDFSYALDWDLLLRFLDAGARIVRLPYVMGAFRVHREQKSSVITDVGAVEIERLLAERGAVSDPQQAWQRLGPYLRRHVMSHTAYRLAMRLPGVGTEVVATQG